jgi:hypothetical protein
MSAATQMDTWSLNLTKSLENHWLGVSISEKIYAKADLSLSRPLLFRRQSTTSKQSFITNLRARKNRQIIGEQMFLVSATGELLRLTTNKLAIPRGSCTVRVMAQVKRCIWVS